MAGRPRPRAPVLRWVHCYDPHYPYEPPPGFAAGHPYHGKIAAMDAELARLFGALEHQGALETTAVLVVSDHGEAFGEHGEESHSALCYQPTLRVPLILRPPGALALGVRSAAVVSVADVFPTLAESMGLELPPGLDGRSLWKPSAEARGVYFES